MHLHHQSLEECPSDEVFLGSFEYGNVKVNLPYPPVALLESVSDAVVRRYKIRRLHLVIVDLWRPWKVYKSEAGEIYHFNLHLTLLGRLQPCAGVSSLGKSPLHCRRFVYGYSLDGSDFPCYFLWPHRTPEHGFWLLESQTHRYVDLNLAGFLQPLGLRHFYDAFGLKADVSIRASALDAFQLQEADLSSDLLVTATAAMARGWTDHDHDEQPVDQNAPEADLRNVPMDVISVSSSEVDSESSGEDDSSDDLSSTTTSSDESSDSEPSASEVSDQQSMLEHAYDQAYDAFHVLQDGTLQGGDATLNLMEIFPPHWPLAKMTLPLKFAVQRLDRLIAGYLMEVIATHHDPDQCRKSTSSFAETLTVRVATYLAKLIASLLRPVLYHPHMIQFDDDTEPMLTSKFCLDLTCLRQQKVKDLPPTWSRWPRIQEPNPSPMQISILCMLLLPSG